MHTDLGRTFWKPLPGTRSRMGVAFRRISNDASKRETFFRSLMQHHYRGAVLALSLRHT